MSETEARDYIQSFLAYHKFACIIRGLYEVINDDYPEDTELDQWFLDHFTYRESDQRWYHNEFPSVFLH